MSYAPEEILERARNWMLAQNWHRKLAKSATGQSLLEHTLIELDVFLSLEPILTNPKRFALTDAESSIVLASLLCHDIGKASDAWQRYVSGASDEHVGHIDPNLLHSIAPEVCAVVGAGSSGTDVERTVELCARYHHSRPERDDATLLEAMLEGRRSFLPLAHIVMDIDRLCSAQTPQAAAAHLRMSDLGKHIDAEWHQVNLRGVSSTFVHKAVQQIFVDAGWHPLIYFANATVYYTDRANRCVTPDTKSICGILEKILADVLTHEVSSLIVGNPTANILPKPDLVLWNETRRYLEQAGGKINPSSFARKSKEARKKVVGKYLEATGVPGPIDDGSLERHSQRISHAQPEMIVFKLFKALMDRNKIPELGSRAEQVAAESYKKIFGDDRWEKLQSTSTLKPAEDMAATIDPYWSLDASVIGGNGGTRVESLPDKDRMSGLVELLDRIIRYVVRTIEAASPRNELAANMAAAFQHDLVHPADTNSDARDLAQIQVDYYMRSKPIAGKEKSVGTFTCPICNAAFKTGRKASADFVDNPQSHTNRGISHGKFGYVMICNACYYERLLRQILMRTRPAEVITLLPPWNIGPRNGEAIVREVHTMIDRITSEMRGDTGDFSSGFSFGLTEQIAQRVGEAPSDQTRSARAVALFRYRISADTNRKRRREVEKQLKQSYDEDLNILNAMCGTAYPSWDAATDAVSTPGALPADLNEIRNDVLRLYPTLALACETPNLVFIPLSYPLAGSAESDANKALRRLFAALLLHQLFGSTVAIHSEPSEIDAMNAFGAAWVPPVAAVRNLTGTDWISPDEADTWLERIGAAARLAQVTGYPPRSAIYQTLMADPAEKLMRRVEGEHRTASLNDVKLIQKLPFFRTSSLYKEAQS